MTSQTRCLKQHIDYSIGEYLYIVDDCMCYGVGRQAESF